MITKTFPQTLLFQILHLRYNKRSITNIYPGQQLENESRTEVGWLRGMA
jgi:hypothetical protein